MRKVGGCGIPGGNNGVACVMAVRMSGGTSLILRRRLNWSVIWHAPRLLTEVIESRPSIVENCRSNGVATVEAIVSGFAPGKLAETTIVPEGQ